MGPDPKGRHHWMGSGSYELTGMQPHQKYSSKVLYELIKNGDIKFAGNKKLKIYGTLSCKSGKRMDKENRVFFVSEEEAKLNHYRPCGLCLKDKYNQWKYESIQ